MNANKKTNPSAPRDDERLAKRVAAMRACSRREAEQYIEGGWVSVDGKVQEEPQFRVSNQTVVIAPDARLMEVLPVTLLLHKPPGFDATADIGAANRRIQPAQALLKPDTHAPDNTEGTRVLQRHFAKLTATVPLETGASGLVVFTQDWRVLRKLEEDLNVMEQELIVEVKGEVAPETLLKLNRGIIDNGQPLPPVKVSINSGNESSSKLRFAIKGSHVGLIAYLCERVGLEILSMKRLRIGRVGLGQLASGQWRYLLGHERF